MNDTRPSLHIFRRDLRLDDNQALAAARKRSTEVIPCFIFDPRQLENNPYRGEKLIQFMVESLEDLSEQIRQSGGRLFYFYGAAEEIVAKLVQQLGIGAVFLNRDYTPFSLKRDAAIAAAAKASGAEYHAFDDLVIFPPESERKDDGSPYTVYTPFYKRQSQRAVPRPVGLPKGKFYAREIEGAISDIPAQLRSAVSDRHYVRGGRSRALAVLEKIESFRDLAATRDFPALDSTTGLSAHHKFGTISPREVYHAVADKLGKEHVIIRELFWREFFTQIGFHFSHVFSGAFHKRYDALGWENSEGKFERWCAGTTGFPIVDAGMRQLNATGFMHNRIRMVVASFLTKDLHIDWRWGERYFAQKLIDYDPAVNNGNWQWAASTGCDAQPYFRIFNPWLQQGRFDPEAKYMKTWIPELTNFSAGQIHGLAKSAVGAYPAPMVDHAEEKARTEKIYAEVVKKG